MDATQLVRPVIADADFANETLLLGICDTIPKDLFLKRVVVARGPMKLTDVDGTTEAIGGLFGGIDDGVAREAPGVGGEFGGDDEVRGWIGEELTE